MRFLAGSQSRFAREQFAGPLLSTSSLSVGIAAGDIEHRRSGPPAFPRESTEVVSCRRYDEPMTPRLRVLVEQPTRGKRWVAVAADWPGLERGGKTEDEAPFDAPLFERKVRLLRAAWAEFDETAARVSAELRPGVRGGGRSRDRLVRHVMATEGGDFSKRVKAKSELEDLLTPVRLARHRDLFVEAMRAWYAQGKPLGNWTIPYLLRHTAYHVLDHTWEMQDRDLTDVAPTGIARTPASSR